MKDINEYGGKVGPTNVQFPIVSASTIAMWESNSTRGVQIADPDRKISTLYDMLDYQDATNRDMKGLPFTVSAYYQNATRCPNIQVGTDCFRY